MHNFTSLQIFETLILVMVTLLQKWGSLTQFNIGPKIELGHDHALVLFHLKWKLNCYIVVMFTFNQSNSLRLIFCIVRLLFQFWLNPYIAFP